MKSCVSIWWLIVSFDLGFIISCHKLKAQETNSSAGGKNDLNKRWQLEKLKFRKGLKVMNDKGQLIEVTADDAPPPGSARRCSREDIHFKLYTKRNPTEPHKLSVDSDPNSKDDLSWSFFNHRNPTYFVSHGWMNTGDSDSCTMIRKALLKDHDVNVIVVDWGKTAHALYGWAVKHLKHVSENIADMIRLLIKKRGLDPLNIVLIGHSLGAHVMGIAGHLMNGTIGGIFGLDPAFPFFSLAGAGDRISATDANYVQIIHTCGGFLGFDVAIGTADFYPDGGETQANCVVDVGGACSHGRAYEYYAESISSDKGFYGRKCSDKAHFLKNDCNSEDFAKMGGLKPDPGIRGTFFLWTNPSRPFAKGADDKILKNRRSSNLINNAAAQFRRRAYQSFQ